MAECSVLEADVDYSFYERLTSLLSDFSANVINTEYADSVKVKFSVKSDKRSELEEKLTDLSKGKVKAKFIDLVFDKV